ncbi:hypothetical protein ACQR1W_12615 [Bradyrhizobium sp. HKCCYLS1011]|uniref:hypothetical protein n=1 Tax=Bradyrhizobium sp. HKCCYLS1011 TaxID=3420733 RepID=UPI003EBF11BF
MLFEITKQSERGTPDSIVARLTVQPIEILNHTNLSAVDQAKFVQLSVSELLPRLQRCSEIEQRLRKEAGERRSQFKPPRRGDVSVEIPQIPNLKAECENFLYEAKNYLRDLLKLVNLLWGTQYEDASEWVQGKKGRPSVQDFIVDKFGEGHVNARFIRQYKACVEPFVLMRNAVEHPKPTELVIKNFTREGTELREATWGIERDGKPEYGPLPIVEDMACGVRNLLVLAEDMLVMAAQANLAAPGLVAVQAIPEQDRKAECPVKYRIRPTAAVLQDIARQ